MATVSVIKCYDLDYAGLDLIGKNDRFSVNFFTATTVPCSTSSQTSSRDLIVECASEDFTSLLRVFSKA